MFSDRRIRTSATALVIDLALTGFRIFLAWLTASVALSADALHSLSDVLVSLALLLSMAYRFREERSGDERRIQRAIKVEGMAVILVSLLILAVPYEIYDQTLTVQNEPITHAWWGIAGIGVVMVLLLFISRLKMLVGIEADSEALKADSLHTKVDLMTSGAVMLSLTGSLIGFNIDEYVALLIALMILITGAELLVTGVRTLSGHDAPDVSLLERCYQTLVRYLPDHIPVEAVARRCRQLASQLWKPVCAVATVVYLTSGITVVPQGFMGVHTRLGKMIDNHIQPGLVWSLPQPFEQVTLLPEGQLYSIAIGSKNSFLRPSYGAKLWYSIKQSQLSREDADYLLTGDEKLMFFTADLQYRLTDPSAELNRFTHIEELLVNLANAVLTRSSAKVSFAQLQQEGFSDYAATLAEQITAEVEPFQLPVEVVSVNVQQIEPPAYLVSQYRDALDAYQESHTLVNQAEGWRLTEIPKARAQHFLVKSEARAQASQRIHSAEGESRHFKALARVYHKAPEAYRFNQQVDIARSALTGKPFTVIDPAFSSQDFRIWGNPYGSPMFQPLQTLPESPSSEPQPDEEVPALSLPDLTQQPVINNGYPDYLNEMSEGERNLSAGERELLENFRIFRSGP
ncbi:cation transporter [Endozoicomonas euniceicola]|uniref:Cation transporter n=1 Tax=Endozoicomonas euniceicola TaxID=1234143 RepID=A0ABY6H0S5_9GAMM|nr:cation transporter [Endozoicomonas euniceicola]UYM18665.1 cation transporter [Endozoicomonas euniceicola]